MRHRVLLAFLALLVPLALLAGVYAGGHPTILPDPIRDAFVDDSDAQIYEQALDMIEDDFYRKVDRGKLADKSLEAAVAALDDRFSRYIAPKDYGEFNESTEGRFEGIGTNVEEVPQGLKIVNVFKDGPADKAGIKPGDIITEANDTPLKGKASDASTQLIKGPAGTMVKLTVVRDEKELTINVKRDRVSVPVSEGKVQTRKGDKFGVVSLSQFTSGAHGEVGKNVRDVIKKGAKGVVLDLRHNGGGLLQEGVLVSSLFIGDGTIVTTDGRNRPRREFTASGDSIDTKIPLVVLVDGQTASASEIVTGALQDRDRATVVGQRTFGKGVFQEIEPLPNGGALDITVGEYFTPDGRNLGPKGKKRGGILPDVEAADKPKTKRDEALDKALSVLGDKL